MFQNNKNNLSPRELQLTKYNSARMNLLLVICVTLINIVLIFVGSGSYFLFSSFVPYFLVFTGMYNCGKMPDDWYEGGKSAYEFLDASFLVTMLVIALIILVCYFVFFLLSKNQKSGWLIAALVFFSIDTLLFLLLGGISVDSILDILFHIWVLYYLISGIIAAKKLKNLPPEENIVEVAAQEVDSSQNP